MTRHTAMNRQEFIKLLEEKGSEPDNWPAQLHSRIDSLLASDAQAAEILAQYQQLDQMLRHLPAPDSSILKDRVSRQALPERPTSLVDSLMNWLFPQSGSGLVWRPAALACLPLLFGVVMANYFNFGIGVEQSLQDWDDELAMISLTDYSQNLIEL